jgi:hypothetical protein
MVDNIKFNKVLPSLSPDPKVKRADQRRRNDQHSPFEEVIKQKRKKKKKKDDSEHAAVSDGDDTTEDGQRTRPTNRNEADVEEQSNGTAPSRIIDIRV